MTGEPWNLPGMKVETREALNDCSGCFFVALLGADDNLFPQLSKFAWRTNSFTYGAFRTGNGRWNLRQASWVLDDPVFPRLALIASPVR